MSFSRRRSGKNLVELQWALLSIFYGVDLDVEICWRELGRTIVGGCEMPCRLPKIRSCALPACGQASWTRLIYLADIAETWRLPGIDYSLVFSAREHWESLAFSG